MNESPNFIHAKQIINSAFDIVGYTGDREALAHKFALTVTLMTFKQIMEKLPADVSAKIHEVLNGGGSEEVFKEMIEFFTQEERDEMYKRNLRLNFQNYIDGVKGTLNPEQLEQLQAIHAGL